MTPGGICGMVETMENYNAEEVAMSRPPDRVVYEDWEDDPTDPEPTIDFVPRWRELPGEGEVFLGYRQVKTPRERRMVISYWERKAQMIPKLIDVSEMRDDTVDMVYAQEYEPGYQIARWHWEYRNRA